MCVQYWPASKGKVEVYDDITVTYTHEEQLANFVIRNFRITRETAVRESYPKFSFISLRIQSCFLFLFNLFVCF